MPSGRRHNRTDRSTYVLYQGDEVIGIGSIDELASRFGVSREVIRHYATPSHAARTPNGRVAVRVADDSTD